MKCYYLTEANQPVVFRRRIRQAQLRYKDYIAKLPKVVDEPDPSNTRPPTPRVARNLNGGTKVSFENPKQHAITAEQLEAFNEQVEDPTTQLVENHAPHMMSIEEKQNFARLEEMLLNTANGKSEDVATPVVANVSSDEMIVDFGEKPGTLIPIHAEWEEPLVPSDYDAYGGTGLNC